MNKFWIHWFSSSLVLMVILYLTISWGYTQCPWCEASAVEQSHKTSHRLFQGKNAAHSLSYGIVTDVHGPWKAELLPTPLSLAEKISYIQQAVVEWQKSDVDFVISLGDFVNFKPDTAELPVDMKLVDEVLKNIGKQVYYSWGNHDFWTFSRKTLWESPFANLEMAQKRIGKDFDPDVDGHYFSFNPRNDVKIIILDSYDSTSIGRADDDADETLGVLMRRLQKRNDDIALFNGGISAKQLEWLDEQVKEADKKGAMVLIHAHIPLDRKTGNSKFFLTNASEVREILQKYRRSLKLFIAGHAHEGAVYRERDDLIHVTIDSWTEESRKRSNSAAFGIVQIWHNRVELHGFGPMNSQTFMSP